ncbi:InlB B-repeat-containing protein [Candidatus Saccharibacteria bacterium]|nr:InlB B-repeat-containing protein [Candidatus Saccharibacteria bacterium]
MTESQNNAKLPSNQVKIKKQNKEKIRHARASNSGQDAHTKQASGGGYLKSLLTSNRRKCRSFLFAVPLLCLFAFALVAIASTFVAPETYAADLSSYVEVQDFSVTREDGTPITIQSGSNASQNLDDYATPVDITVSSRSRLSLSVKFHLAPGVTVKTGDTVKIPFVSQLVGGKNPFSVGATDWVNITNASGETIAQWYHSGANLWIKFTENANGLAELPDFTFSNLAVLTEYVFTPENAYLGQVTVNSVDYYFKIATPTHDFSRMTNSSKYVVGAYHNNRASYGFRVSEPTLFDSMFASLGQDGTPKGILIEDTVPGATDIALGGDGISPLFLLPTNLANDGSANPSISYGHVLPGAKHVNLTSLFTKLNPNSGEPYADFKSRVTSRPLQYGTYIASDGTPTILIYFGRPGIDAPSVYDLASNPAENFADNAIANGYYPQSSRTALIDFFNAVYGNGSKFNGRFLGYVTWINVYYNQVSEDVPVSNSATIYYDSAPKTFKRDSVLLASSVISTTPPEPHSATAFLSDTDSKQLLKGAKLKLQIKNGSNWQDYTPNDGDGLLRTTNENGQVNFGNLGLGTYRLVQTAPKTGYSLKTSACTANQNNPNSSCPNTQTYDETNNLLVGPEFTISSSDTEGAKLFMTNKKIYYLYVNYNLNGGTIIDPHGATYHADTDGWLIVDGSAFSQPNQAWNHRIFTYGQAMISTGLTDYNNPDCLNAAKPGYHVDKAAAWNTKPDGTGTSYSQHAHDYQSSDFADLTHSDQTIKLYLNWQPNTYTIAYDSNDPNPSKDPIITTMTNQTHTYDTTKSLTKNSFTKPGYTFKHWNTKPDDTGDSYTDEQSITNLTTTNNDTITLYAIWEKNPDSNSPADPTTPTDPIAPTDSANNQDTEAAPKSVNSANPKTNDANKQSLMLPFIIFGASLSGVISLLVLRKRF